MYQGGIREITLYEDNGIQAFHYDPLDLNKITNLRTNGSTISILNEQLPSFDFNVSLGKNGVALYSYSISFHILGYDQEKMDDIAKMGHSLNGWSFLVTYYDGTSKFYKTPLFLNDSKIKMQKEMAFEVTLSNRVPSTIGYLDYVAGQVNLESYRFDTTVLTFDTAVYRFDYDL